MPKNVQPITQCAQGDITPYVFLCGDPARVPKIASSWQDTRQVCRLREYTFFPETLQRIATNQLQLP